MADKRITDVDFLDSLNNNESFFVNQNNSIKQINKADIVFDVANGGTGANNVESARMNLGLGSVAVEDVLPINKGGTGSTTSTGALTKLGITATAAELNKLDGVTATTVELNYVDGVTSNIQTQLNGKASSSHNHAASNITSGTLSSDRLPTVPIAKGGTGATTAAAARTNLGVTPANIGAKVSGAVESVSTGGTGSSNGATGLKNLLAAGETILSSYQYGNTLPSSGTAGRIFFKKISG